MGSAAGRAPQARPAPLPGSGLRVSAEPAGTWTGAREWGGPASAATAAGGARASARARLVRAGERAWSGGSARARGSAVWAVGAACDPWWLLQTRAAALTPRRAQRCGPWWCCCCWPQRPAVSGLPLLALRLAACAAPPQIRMCGLRPGWPHGALEKVAPARDARALRTLARRWGGPSG